MNDIAHVLTAMAEMKGQLQNLDTGLRAEITASTKHSDTLAEMLKLQLTSTDKGLDRVNLEVGEYGVRSHAALHEHIHAVNPHPAQEAWLREHLVAQGRELNAIKTDLSEEIAEIKAQLDRWRGSMKTLVPVLAILTSVLSAVLSRVVGA